MKKGKLIAVVMVVLMTTAALAISACPIGTSCNGEKECVFRSKNHVFWYVYDGCGYEYCKTFNAGEFGKDLYEAECNCK